MIHILPGGRVPRVHGARSPVPPRLPLLVTPRSVHRLAAVAAGAYPPRRPPNAWLPRVPAPPGPCYWLVASGTPLGWRGGCLAVGLVRGAVRHCCLGGCSALVVCARRLLPVRGGWCRCRVWCLPRFPLAAPHSPRCVWRAIWSGCPLCWLAGTQFHAVCAFSGLGLVALLVFPACPVFFVRHGGPPPKALYQSGLTMGKMSNHGEPKFSEGQPRVFTNPVRVKTLHELHHGPEKVEIQVEAISVKDAKGYIAYTKRK